MKGGEIRPQVILFEPPDKSLSLKRYHRCKFLGNFSLNCSRIIIHEQRQYSMEKIYTFGFRLSNNPATKNEKLIRTKYIFSTIEFIHITSILCSRLAKKGFVRISILSWIEFSYCVYLLSIYLYISIFA